MKPHRPKKLSKPKTLSKKEQKELESRGIVFPLERPSRCEVFEQPELHEPPVLHDRVKAIADAVYELLLPEGSRSEYLEVFRQDVRQVVNERADKVDHKDLLLRTDLKPAEIRCVLLAVCDGVAIRCDMPPVGPPEYYEDSEAFKNYEDFKADCIKRAEEDKHNAFISLADSVTRLTLRQIGRLERYLEKARHDLAQKEAERAAVNMGQNKLPKAAPKCRKAGRKRLSGKKEQSQAKLQHWIQADLDEAIRKYKSKRAARYSEILKGVRENKLGAMKAVREMFGRNVIARKLGVRSRSMVSKSPAWTAIAEELGIPLNRNKARGTRKTQQTGKIGLDIASEEASLATVDESDPAALLLMAEREETLRVIRKLSAKEAKPIFDKYDAGEMTDEQARETVRTLLKTD